jgi:hypothetical protein
MTEGIYELGYRFEIVCARKGELTVLSRLGGVVDESKHKEGATGDA